jgi:hypothetical protein
MRTLRLALAGTVMLALLGAPAGSVLAQSADDATAAPTSEPGSILFVGNSYTYWLDGVDAELARLVASEEPPRTIDVERFTLGGATLKQLYQDSIPEARFGAVDLVSSGKFDTVVLQGDLPEYSRREDAAFIEYARLFDEQAGDVDARTVFYMTWPDGWASLDDIVAAHRQVEEELGAVVAPAAVAIESAKAERPDLRLLAGHQTPAGMYLIAATIYATVFDRSPEGLTYHDGLLEEDAAFLQRVAWETVQEWREGTPPAD